MANEPNSRFRKICIEKTLRQYDEWGALRTKPIRSVQRGSELESSYTDRASVREACRFSLTDPLECGDGVGAAVRPTASGTKPRNWSKPHSENSFGRRDGDGRDPAGGWKPIGWNHRRPSSRGRDGTGSARGRRFPRAKLDLNSNALGTLKWGDSKARVAYKPEAQAKALPLHTTAPRLRFGLVKAPIRALTMH
jgi:hypothetical protein